MTAGRAFLDPGRVRIRVLIVEELDAVRQIDVTEDGDLVFEQHGATLRQRTETWHRPARSDDEWQRFEDEWRTFIPAGGLAFGAFDGERLVGIATLRRGVRAGVDQLEALFVDRAHRRQGVASMLVAAVEAAARGAGASALYVSATPSRSAVGFYLSRGFRPTEAPIPELLAREPEDVHMVLDL